MSYPPHPQTPLPRWGEGSRKASGSTKVRLPSDVFGHTTGFSGERQGHGGPTGGCGGDPLIRSMGESALEVRLQRQRPGLNQPGAVFQLSFKQELSSFLVSWIADRQASALVQSD